MSAHTQRASTQGRIFPDLRQNPRFDFQTDIRIYSKKAGLLQGHTVDICEAGISAILTLEVGIGEIVQLEFNLPPGPVAIRAMVRHKTAFRYGFQFVEPDASGIIKRTCDALSAPQNASVSGS